MGEGLGKSVAGRGLWVNWRPALRLRSSRPQESWSGMQAPSESRRPRASGPWRGWDPGSDLAMVTAAGRCSRNLIFESLWARRHHLAWLSLSPITDAEIRAQE